MLSDKSSGKASSFLAPLLPLLALLLPLLPLLLLPLLLFFAPLPGLGAGEMEMAPFRRMLDISGFPENDETRRLMSQALNAPNYAAVETTLEMHRQLSDSRLVEFEVRKGMLEWYLIFRNQRGQEPRETFPLWGRGNWIIKKSLLDGTFIQAKIFLQDNEDSFVRLFPLKDQRCRLDVYLYGRQLGDDVIVPVAFDSLLTAPFARILELTGHAVDWGTLFPNPDLIGYRRAEQMVSLLAPFSAGIQEFPDAALNTGGLNCRIETGEVIPPEELEAGKTGMNCSGYVKWVADGIYSAWSKAPGSLFMDVDLLRASALPEKPNSWNAARSAEGREARQTFSALLRDPRFGLNWNRNIARIIREAQLGEDIDSAAARELDAPGLPGVSWIPDMGYTLDELGTALYQLAASEPGKIWLAAVNSPFKPKPSPQTPRPLSLHQYWHTAVLVPWFDNGAGGGERGSFHVAVLDTGQVAESLLPRASSSVEPAFLRFIQEKATAYARLGRDDEGSLQQPEVRVHLTGVDLPGNYMPAFLPSFEAR